MLISVSWKKFCLECNTQKSNLLFRSIPPNRLDELAVEASKLYKLYLKQSFHTKAARNKSVVGAFQIYYSKQREKEISIGRSKISTAGKRKRAEDGEDYFCWSEFYK